MPPDTAEAFDALVRARRSVRGFRSDPVPAALIRRAFEMAQQAPSNCNTQPWVVHVVSGASAEKVRSLLYGAAAGGEPPQSDYAFTGNYKDIYRDRQVAAAKALFAATGVGRDDPGARRASLLRNYRFFDAPHAAFLFLRNDFGMREAADCGMYAQTLMLAFTALGIASCAQGALGHRAPPVREALGVPDTHLLLFGIAFGWEDDDHPANTARTDRLTVDEAIVFHD